MSIQENKLTEIANAIRKKDGTTAPIPASQFVDRILAIKSGGNNSDFSSPLTIYSEPGTVITGTNGENTFTVTTNENGQAQLILTKPGNWELTAISTDNIERTATLFVSNGNSIKIDVTPSLPDGYTKLEYIESTGTQYIDTNFKSADRDRRYQIMSEIKLTDINVTEEGRLLGYDNYKGITDRSRAYLSVNSDGFYYTGLVPTDGVTVGNGGYSTVTKIMDLTEDKILYEFLEDEYKIRLNNNELIVNGLALNQSVSVTLFGVSEHVYNSSTRKTTSTMHNFPMRLYSFSIKDIIDNVYKRRMIPCIDPSGIVGLYDLAEEKFYKYGSTNTFIAGPVAEE